jgi:uncharacterized protein YhaN
MEIREIHIDGFGIFNQTSLNIHGNGIHIILGDNEAGKSTLLKFIRYTLFGYPRFVEQRMAPVNGGNHGGRIKTLLSSGNEAIFERDGKDRIKLLYNGQESGNVSLWTQLLGNASGSLYNNVYAITLDELAGLASIKESGMEDKIFSLGLGLGNISISGLEGTIRSRSEEIYKSRGKMQLISQFVKEIDEKHAGIRQIQDNLAMYRQLTADIELLSSQTQDAENELKELRQEFARVDTHLKCFESYVGLKRAEEELKALPPLKDYPEKGQHQMETALRLKEELTEKQRQLNEGHAGEKGIVELSGELESLTINAELLQRKEKVDYIRLNLAGYKQTLKERADEVQLLRELDGRIMQNISDKINVNWSELDVLSFRDAISQQSRLEYFIERLRKATDEKRDWDAQQKALMSREGGINAIAISRILALVFAVGAIPFFYYGFYIPGAALLIIALIFITGRKFFEKEDTLTPVKQKISSLEHEQAAILEEYRAWLQKELHLSKDLSFPAVTNAFQAIEKVKELIGQRDSVRQKIQEVRLPQIYEYEGKISEMRPYLEHDPGGENKELLAAAIIDEFDRAMEEYKYGENLGQELNRKQKENKILLERISDGENVIRKLFDLVGVSTADDFFGKYAKNERVKTLLETRKNAREKIETVAGLNNCGNVVEYLTSHDRQFLQTRNDELVVEIGRKEFQTSELHKEKGAKTREKDRLASESDLAQKLTELETLREKLRVAYKEWLAGQLALKILSDVKDSFENEKQPAVIRNSGNYFSNITGGRYAGIRASLEGREVSVFDQREATLDINQLSRGTKEQLLVSLRLGFIEEYERQAESLPVIVDEIFVNFDGQRAKQTARILNDFAANRQILIFTCHSSTIDLFDASRVNVVKMNDGKGMLR